MCLFFRHIEDIDEKIAKESKDGNTFLRSCDQFTFIFIRQGKKLNIFLFFFFIYRHLKASIVFVVVMVFVCFFLHVF